MDRSFRRRGVSRALIDRAHQWVAGADPPAIILEAQNNNPPCRFYNAYSFRVGRYDRYLYTSLDMKTMGIAVYWYYFL